MSSSRLQVRSLGGPLGAEIFGVALAEGGVADIAAVRSALDQYLVLVIRDQNISPEQQVALTRRFGPAPKPVPMSHMRAEVENRLSDRDRGVTAVAEGLHLRWLPHGASLVADELNFIGQAGELIRKVTSVCLSGATDTREDWPTAVLKEVGEPGPRHDVWHADLSYIATPPRVGFLYAKEIPGCGLGDTAFANMIQAHQVLSAGLRSVISNLQCVHSADTAARGSRSEQYGRAAAAMPLPVLHPMVGKTVNGQDHLFCNPHYVTKVSGFELDESDALLKLIYGKSLAIDGIYRHQWRSGDLVLWDNRATMHYGIHDYPLDSRRILIRTLAC